MTIAQLDYYFPFIVLLYGALMTLVLSNPFLVALAEKRLPVDQWQRFRSHRGLGLVCLVVGGLWALQHVWYF